MGYYRGDYYRGDYYQGDFLGSLKSFATKAFKALSPSIPIVGPAIAALTLRGKALNAGIPLPAPSIPFGLPGGGAIDDYLRRQTGGQSFGPSVGALPPPPGMGVTFGGHPIMGGTEPTFARGYRFNKSTYVVRGGGTSRWGPAGQMQLIPKGTVAVKTRRMNVANPRALRRGLRRAAGFVKLARRAHVRLSAFTGRKSAKKKK